jgi:hypothetical protein
LLGILSANVVKVPVPIFKDPSVFQALPSIAVCPIGIEELPEDEATNKSDAYVYSSLVAIVAESDQDLIAFGADPTKLKRYLFWRQVLLDLFSHNRQAFSSITIPAGENIDCISDPDVVIDLRAWDEESLYVSPLSVRVTIDRQRQDI